MILNPRGTNGSGKSTIVRAFMKPDAPLFEVCKQTLLSPTKKEPDRMKDYPIIAQEGVNGTAILGSYRNNCGGCDEFSWKGSHDAMCDAIRILAKEYRHVIFEGITVSSVYTRYANLAEEIYMRDGMPTHWLLISPPLDTCLSRVEARTGRMRDERMINNVGTKHRVVESFPEKIDGEPTLGMTYSFHTDNEAAMDIARKAILS